MYPLNIERWPFSWAKVVFIWAQNLHNTPAVPKAHYKVRYDFNGVNRLYIEEHFAINIFFIKDFSSIKYRIECSAFPSDCPRVTLIDLLYPRKAAESSGEMKIVIPCLSACLFNFNPTVLASSKVVLRLWECFFNAIGMSKWHLHFIILYTVGKNRELT